jgi:NCAIR mutase (PurE)-related protein
MAQHSSDARSDRHDTVIQQDGRFTEFARPDLDRGTRKGVPEVLLAQGKREEDVLAIARQFVDKVGRAIVSRVSVDLVAKLRSEFSDCLLIEHSPSRIVVIKRHDFLTHMTGGKVGVISAGTSDVPIAEEARVLAEEMGCDTFAVYDVGVAGIHRLFEPLQSLRDAGVDALVVAAGMDGALPSVVAGLVDVPVIGLPTSVGYGLGGKGVAALMSMLQTCSPGLVVVNIDNGIGAGATAALIANRMAWARQGK